MNILSLFKKKYQETTATTLANEWPQKGAVLLDVRTKNEFAQGHVKGAKNLDVMDRGFEAKLQQLDPDLIYYVICRSGGRSASASRTLAAKGFQHVINVRGGIMSWKGSLVR